MKILIPIISRYSSILVQFLLVTLIARALTPDDAGTYFLVSGLTLATYFLAGLGIPDGLVAACPAARALGNGNAVRHMAMKGVAYSCGISLILPITVYLLFRALQHEASIALPASILCMGYSFTFIAAQTLVATEKVQPGSFVFYSAINTCLCFTTVPYLLIAKSPGLIDVLAINAHTALAAGGASLAFTIWHVHKLTGGGSSVSLVGLWKNGLLISLGRVVQASILWMPVWIAGILLTNADAALLGLAGRLLSIVGALLAAIRFAIRPTLAFLASRNDWRAVERISGNVALVASAFSVAAMATAWLFGEDLIALVFGESYRPASALLFIMLGATLAESVGGAVDEILKMSSKSGVVLASQIIALLAIAVLGPLLTLHYGARGAAAASVISFATMYGIQIFYASRFYGIAAFPKITYRKTGAFES